MLQLNNTKNIRVKGHELDSIMLFIEVIQMVNGKDYTIALYPYLSKASWKQDFAHNHFRHELEVLIPEEKEIEKEYSIIKGELLEAGDIVVTLTSFLLNDVETPIPAYSKITGDIITQEDCKVLRRVKTIEMVWKTLEDIEIKTSGQIENPLTYNDAKEKVIDKLKNLNVVEEQNIQEL